MHLSHWKGTSGQGDWSPEKVMSLPVSHSSVFDPRDCYFWCLHFSLSPAGLVTLEIPLTYQLAR